jgi:hypothetical protein
MRMALVLATLALVSACVGGAGPERQHLGENAFGTAANPVVMQLHLASEGPVPWIDVRGPDPDEALFEAPGSVWMPAPEVDGSTLVNVSDDPRLAYQVQGQDSQALAAGWEQAGVMVLGFVDWPIAVAGGALIAVVYVAANPEDARQATASFFALFGERSVSVTVDAVRVEAQRRAGQLCGQSRASSSLMMPSWFGVAITAVCPDRVVVPGIITGGTRVHSLAVLNLTSGTWSLTRTGSLEPLLPASPGFTIQPYKRELRFLDPPMVAYLIPGLRQGVFFP